MLATNMNLIRLINGQFLPTDVSGESQSQIGRNL
jgi:hypothetical protein